MEELIKQKNPTLHRYLFTVTTLSKLLAMFFFILFPFVGFYLGMMYQDKLNVTIPVVSKVSKTEVLIPTINPTITTIPTISKPKFVIKELNNGNINYENLDYGFSIQYPKQMNVFVPYDNKEESINLGIEEQAGGYINLYLKAYGRAGDGDLALIFVYNPSNPSKYSSPSKFNTNPDIISDIPIGVAQKEENGDSYIRKTDIKVDNQTAYVIQHLTAKNTTGEIQAIPINESIYYKKNNFSYQISGSVSNGNDMRPKTLDFLHQLISTFKFTN